MFPNHIHHSPETSAPACPGTTGIIKMYYCDMMYDNVRVLQCQVVHLMSSPVESPAASRYRGGNSS